ncbi:MAG: glucan biosynthesis protein C [Candidatus Azotimanducaceae bacterium]|jgi:glucan biosynthesis protein C
MEDSRRYYSLDALRGIMMMLGIVLHGSQWYMTSPPGGLPIPTDPSTSYVFDVLIHFIHSFRMPLFFVLAGFFGSLLVAKRGIGGTYINRGKRILAPLLVSIFTILPLTILGALAFFVSARFGTHQIIPSQEQIKIIEQEMVAAGLPAGEPSLGHLWFLYYLLYFYLTIPLCQFVLRLSAGLQGKINRWIASPFFFLILGALSSLALWPFRGGVLFEGFVFIKPHLPSLIYYGSFFVMGYIIHHHREILVSFVKYLPWFVVISVVLFPLAMIATASEFDADIVSDEVHGRAVIVNAFLTWSLIYMFMGLFLRFLDFASPWILYISNSSYWVYLFHMPVISFAAWLMLPFELPAIIKFLIIASVTTIACFSSYHYLIQNSWVSQLLNGMRFKQPWPWRKA